MLKITQGDTVTFNLTAQNGNNIPFDLTGAVFTSQIKGPGGTVVVIPDAQHVANPDQNTYTGKYTMALTSLNTLACDIGEDMAIITKVVQGVSTIYFHGTNILTVLANVP